MTRRQWHLSVQRPVRGLVRANLGATVGVGISGAVAGLVEAFLVVLIVALATTVAGDAVNVEGVSFGPISLAGVDLSTSFLLGGVGLIIFIATQALAAWFEAKASAAQLVEARFRLVDAYVNTDWPTKADLGEGELVAYAGEFVQMAFQSLSQAMNLIGAAMSFVALLLSAIVVSPLGALVVLGAGGAFTLLMRPLTNLTRRYASLQGDETKEFVAQLSRLVSVSREMTTFDIGDVLAGQVRAKAAQVAGWARQNRFVLRMVPPIYRTAVLAVILLGLGLVVRFDLTDIGSLAAIVLILLRAMNYTQTVQARLQSLAETEPYLTDLAERIRDFDERQLDRSGAGLDHLDHIEFDGVSFSYEEGTPVLKGLSLRLERGQMLAVVGPSGAGKSTFVDLLLRLRTPTEGRVLVNGGDARNVATGAWYSRVGFVPQETKLVLGSIADNVVFHRSGIGSDHVRTALAQAQLRDLVGRRGMDDSIGERGSLLSGGQRQRVGIARAFVGEPDLLILDEPTSALDLDSEHRIVETLQQLGADRITVMISHRPAVLRVCDAILVLHRDKPHELHAAASIEDAEQFLRTVVGEVMDDEH